MKNIFTYLTFVFFVVALYGFTFSFAGDDAGKKVFEEKKCNTCHTVASAKIESKKKDATDLSAVGANHKADFFAKYLNKNEKIDDKQHKVAFKGTDEELASLTKWLESLKKK